MDFTFWKTAGLLVLSNTFMTLAWYGHLNFRNAPILLTILVSWLIALPEYALQVPANRLGYGTLSGYELKILQECITLIVFMVFAFFALKEAPSWRHLLAFGLILSAVAVTYIGK